MRHLGLGLAVSLTLALAAAGCQGRIGGSGPPVLNGDAGSGLDAGRVGGTDAGTSSGDASVTPAVDAFVGTDAYVAPDPTCTTGTPLEAPIAGCMPAPPPTTGDPHVDCVARINQFRCECQHLPPLMRWVDGEACADQMAQYDHDNPTTPHAAFRAGICAGGSGQNECPRWPSVSSTISGCLQQMWDEGPGDFFGPPPHGHYINMSSTSFSMVACGFYEGSGGTYAVQNFR
jgi:hypothetical protein